MDNEKMDKMFREIREWVEFGTTEDAGVFEAREALDGILRVVDANDPLAPGWLKRSLDGAKERVNARPPELRPRRIV